MSQGPSHLIDLIELERQARELLPAPTHAFIAGGADDELTLQDNVTAWSRLRLRPRVLRGVGQVSTQSAVLGTTLAAPIMIAPVSYQRLIHSEGEAETARGGAAAGSLLVISTRATVSFEEIARAGAGLPLWFQVYILRDRGWTAELAARAASAGCRALVLTVDAPTVGRNLRAERNNFTFPQSQLANLGTGVPLDPAGLQAYAGAQHDPTIGLDDITWLRETANLPVVVKGVLRGDDAVACVDAGADAVAVSNHGGRQLDTAVATAEALREVADSVRGRAEVYVDGGIRRGTDVLKALALGATAVMVGRPVVWGLATGGANGVSAVLNGLKEELARAMMLCQTATVADIAADLLVASGVPGVPPAALPAPRRRSAAQ